MMLCYFTLALTIPLNHIDFCERNLDGCVLRNCSYGRAYSLTSLVSFPCV